VTGAQLIAEAAYASGNFSDVMSFPSFGAERRGAPVQAFTRISNKKIWVRSPIRKADVIIIMDETVVTPQIFASVKPGGLIVVNTEETPEEFIERWQVRDAVVATCGVTRLCMDNGLTHESAPILNSPILGVLLQVFQEIPMVALEKALLDHFGPKRAPLNIEVARQAACATKQGRASP
jgi:2-oxoacid:acceptor oxidoreductase gamma subunit (pyruvate/2-ketoisovalerate family)